MSRVSDLEKKVDALERNVGMLAKEVGLDDCSMISDYSSIRKYRDGIECERTPVKNGKGAFDIRDTKTVLVINKTPIYEYDGTAIYDLHIPDSLAYIWKTHMFVGGGVIRGITVSDIEKFLEENEPFLDECNVVQDINNMSDIYLIP